MVESNGLRIDGFRKRMREFEITASFKLGRGGRLGVAARSGSGKTTLLRLIAGLTKPDDGTIWLNSRNLLGLPAEKRAIGYVFQEAALFPTMNVLKNATFALTIRGVSRQDSERTGREWLEQVGLASMADKTVDHLSGGEKQRLALVRAMIWKPELILLDEPFSALDAHARHELQEKLLELHALWPVPLILVSHDDADLKKITTCRLLCLEDGAVGQDQLPLRKFILAQ